MNEQQIAHLNRINGINTEPEIVAVVQKVEETGDVSLIIGGNSYKSGDYYDYKGKKYLVEFSIDFSGNVADDIDMSVIKGYISSEAYDRVHKTIVTTSTPIYGTKPGRTFRAADVKLFIDGKRIEQESFYRGMGSRVVCTDEDGTITLDRYAFKIPNTVFGSRPQKQGKHFNTDI